jgi:organic hydroperoxide reductase OsmC/OhrA
VVRRRHLRVDDAAQQLAEKAHQVCPYSNATRGNIDVKLVVTDD